MNASDAYEIITAHYSGDLGRFYGSTSNLIAGAGTIASGVAFPMFDQSSGLFATVRGVAYIVTHECDLDEGNVRFENDDLIVCPIERLERFVDRLNQNYTDSQISSFLANIAKRNMFRLMYFPPFGNDLPYGGIASFNRLASTNLRLFQIHNTILQISVSAFGLREVDYFIQNHFLRTKSDRLWLAPH